MGKIIHLDFDKYSADKMTSIREWLEDHVGYEVGYSMGCNRGIGWHIQCTSHDFSYAIRDIEVYIEDDDLATLFALKWT